MVLSYLNKKPWHTGAFKNIEKVWLAEQDAKDQDKVRDAKLKKLQEEKHNEDLKRMQIESGLIPKSHLNRLDWMYEGGAIKNTTAEEYLLGKPVDQGVSDFRPTLFKESTANPANEAFTRLHEDPLYKIRAEEKKRVHQVNENETLMKKLREKIEALKEGKVVRKKRRRSRSRSPFDMRQAARDLKRQKKRTREQESPVQTPTRRGHKYLSNFKDQMYKKSKTSERIRQAAKHRK